VRRRLPGSAAGEFYVDATCIDCDQCRRIAPATFRAQGDKSVVFRQPATVGEARSAEMALVTCPTGSIGSLASRDVSEAVAAYPELLGEGIYFCGFASEDTFGASSYLIVRPGGNVLVDSPRFAAPLAERIGALGGVRFMFLSHIDDVGPHPDPSGRRSPRHPYAGSYAGAPGPALPRPGPLHRRPPRLVATSSTAWAG